jgi:serine/threonine protein kinase
VFQPLQGDDPRRVSGYSLRARIGAGGMGSVYLSYSPGGRPVAVKVARPELAEDPGFRARFAQEVALATRVQGLYTAPVLDSDPDAPRPWLATAYIPAPSLATVLAAQGRLPKDTVAVLAAGVAEALQAIHGAGVVHRDLKPGNVIVAADGPRVIDFGISRALESSSAALTGTAVRIGTPAFMAPEQVRGHRAGQATDVFALGAMLYYAATGELPFGGDAAVFHRIVAEEPDWELLDQALRPTVSACLDKDPASRPTPEQVISLSRQATQDQRLHGTQGWLPSTVTAMITSHERAPVPDVPRVTPRTVKSRAWWAVGAAALLVCGTGIGLGVAATPGGHSRADNPGTPSAAATGSPTSTAPASFPSTTPSAAPTAPDAGSAAPPILTPSAAAVADTVRWHGELEIPYTGTVLDTTPPSPSTNAALTDISWDAGNSLLHGYATLWTQPGTPTSRQCTDQVTTHPDGGAVLNRVGTRLCLKTTQGRGGFAIVRKIGDYLTLDVTIWELPPGVAPSSIW